jgi:ubiquinone/menaquinone biosynthesis C-methylase UbiE
MLLNRFEFALMTSPIRALIQEIYEMKKCAGSPVRKLSARPWRSVCGSGAGSAMIMKYFSPARLTCIDPDRKMISLARQRSRNGPVTFQVMDASELSFNDASLDAVFVFGAMHHIPDPSWKRAIGEIHRVLKDGRQLIIEDMSAETFQHGSGRLLKPFMSHPYDKMLRVGEFREFLEGTGFKILSFVQESFLGFRYFSLAARKIPL